MPEHLLFLTGSLAEAGLRRVLQELHEPDFSWEVREMGLKVAALMTGRTESPSMDTLNFQNVFGWKVKMNQPYGHYSHRGFLLILKRKERHGCDQV